MTYSTTWKALLEHMVRMEKQVEVAVGTYEELILGYNLILNENKYELTESFTNHCHTGCVKKLAISSNGILASGSTDETIWLFNLRKRTEIGSLVHHDGTVTWLDFHKTSHLFSTSEDGKLCVWKAFSWECLRAFKGHKGGINCGAVHPSGKMALTVGQDRSLHTWNLVRGRSAYITNIKQAADIVEWSPDGTAYLIVFNNRIDLYKVETASIYHTIKSDKRINAVKYLRSSLLAYGCEGGDIVVYNCQDMKEVCRVATETSRVRDLTKVKTSSKDAPLLLVSASSDGNIKVYKVSILQDSVTMELVASHDTKFRLTCIAAAEIKQTPKSSKSADQAAEEDDEIMDDVENSEDSESESETSDNQKEAGAKSPEGKSSEVDSGHIEDTSESEEEITPKTKAKKPSFTEYKKAQQQKRKAKAMEKEKDLKKRKKEKSRDIKTSKKPPSKAKVRK